ncbi:hypothetical protein N0V84_010260 [Fusarium piperis]|uniref:Carrier domain-containing protein n=1 Tax=Fusarium piperis TaxID=1435070 RepID=A0A9W8W4S0_9HYPO|nr:hypothetical protein N0V84_010260 [Fusarium piperis]
MQLLRHVEKHEDFFLPSTESGNWDFNDAFLSKEKVSTFSDVEAVFPATEVQKDILKEDVQWAQAVLFTGKPSSFDLEKIFNAWNSLASRYVCLRSLISADPLSGQPQVVILRRVERIKWGRPEKTSRGPHEGPAYVTVESAKHIDGISLVLRFRRALVDTTSLYSIRLDCALQIHGLPGLESTGFTTYLRYLDQQRGDIESSKLYWTKILAEAVPQFVFGTDTSVSGDAAQDRHGVSAAISGSDLDKITSNLGISQGSKSWRQAFFEVIWAHVLSVHTGSDEVLFGTVRRDENFIGSDSCVGCLDQTYPVRLRVSGDETLTVRNVSESLEAYHKHAGHHAFIGFDEIQRHALYSKPIETAVNYSQTTNTPCIGPGLRRFPVVLCISDASVLRVTLKCKAKIPPEEIEIILRHFVSGITSAASQLSNSSDCPLSSIDIISESERHSILSQSHVTRTAQPTTIPALFEHAVALHADRVAVDFEGKASLSFSELNSRANILARRLSLEKGAIVPILSERSLDLVVAILAILKSGAVYTVLDPDTPPSRLEQVISDCKPATILASHKYINTLPSATNVQELLSSPTNGSHADNGNLNVQIDPEDRCYIIYTSGSTGKPKGAVLTHQAATSGMQHHSLNKLSRWLLFYNPSFSAAQRTILSTLVHGGTLVVASKEALTGDLTSITNRLSVDSLGITPSALSLLQPEDVPTLKQITLVGEQIPQELVDTWSAREGLTLKNTYGLSECTQLNFARELRGQPGEAINPRVVNPPADTTSVFILRQGTTELSPLLVSGELCLAGPQLAQGYINEPELTARHFIDNPFGRGKLYRTGDKARRLARGQIEIQGRIDMQVKINGQKVEPAEIDRFLLDINTVASSVTLALKIEDRTILVAGIVLANSFTFRDAVVTAREHLREHLPAYMVPGIWLPLKEIPKNGNGKINYHWLRAQARELGVTGFAKLMEANSTEPEANTAFDEVEEKIATAWATVLRADLSTIRRSYTFTDLGGSSIQAIQATSELQKVGIATGLGDLLGDVPLQDVAARSHAFDAEDPQDLEPLTLITDDELLSKLRKDGSIVDAYPVTPFQETMLVSLNTPSDPYTYSRAWDTTRVDLARLRRSFEQVFEAREILRTVFVPHKRSFVQIVRKDMSLPWSESIETAEFMTAEEKNHQWSLDQPLWKVTVSVDEALVVTMHHSLFDFWSHQFLYDDVAAVYLGSTIPQRPSFNKFVQYLQNEGSSSDTSFWSTYLEGAEVTKLNHSPLAQASKIEVDLGFSISALASSAGLTLGTVVYTTWAILLSRQLGTNEVTFATTVSGREVPVASIHHMDGPTMTTVPQRIKLDPKSTLKEVAKTAISGFSQLLKHSQVGMLGALKAGKLAPEVVDTLVNILVGNNGADGTLRQDSHAVFKMRGSRPQWASGSDTTVLEVEESEGPAPTTIVRLTSTMEAKRLKFIKDSFVKTVTLLLEQPQSTLASTTLIDNAEHGFLYNKLSNRETLHVPEEEFLHNAFEKIARDIPDTIAIDFDGEEVVSYAALDKLANRFAHTLIGKGVQPGDLVPLVLEKSVDMMVAILGVMKAGGAYVPLSPDNPKERNTFIVSDTKAKIVVVHPQHSDFGDYVKEQHEGVEILVMQNRSSLNSVTKEGRDAEVAPVVDSTPNALAYLIYTSGSTGLPKGVRVPHRTATAAVTSMAQVEGRSQGVWRTLQFANYVFDASVQDFFNTLSTGGTLCMAPTETLLSDVVGCINRMDARQAIITPTVAKLFSPDEVPRFETLIVGGEPLTPDVVESWGTHCKILNVYGPTETSMVVTTKHVEYSSESDDRRIGNIGAPFPTVMAFIVDPNGEALQPYGAVGELCIAGPQVTDGYMNRPDLTDAAYVDSPVLNARLYRTGDLARWLPGGEIECLGRKDNQVKIHGHRIELGEVENAIRSSGLVKDTVVVAASVHEKMHLVAFCIYDEQIASAHKYGAQDPSLFQDAARNLREKLGSLATYMVPKFVIPMSTFPKLPSRKVDRKTLKKRIDEFDREYLAQCVFDSPAEGHAVVPVETLAELTLESIWADIFSLSTDQIGREANFFALGGDSVSAISLTGQLRRVEYSLTVLDILKSPKLKDMAAAMRKTKPGGQGPERVFQVPQVVKQAAQDKGLSWGNDVEYAYPCPPGQAQFLSQGARDSQMWVLQTIRRMAGDVDPATWIKATTRLTEVNDILRTTWVEASPGDWVGVVLRNPQLNVTKVALDSEEEISQFVEEFWQKRFEFGPSFIKYAIITHQDSSWDLVIKMNHAVYDGTLFRIFDEDFGAILRGQTVPPRVEFREFAQYVFQQGQARSLRYWSDKMADLGPIDQTLHGRDLSVVSAPKVTASLRRLIDTTGIDKIATQLGVTVSIIFQAAFSLWLAAATGATDIRFDYLLSGRNVALPDPQSINGTLANFLPFRTRISPKEQVKNFLSALQDDFWAATENGLVGLDSIYRAVGISRQTHGNRILFLSQPFEPAAQDDLEGQYRWLIMAKSKVRMYQPYALVVEVSKSLGDRHVLKVMYDDKVFDLDMVETIADDITGVIETLTDPGTKELALEAL